MDLEVEPPVKNEDGDLVVGCASSDCDRTRAVGTSVDAVQTDLDDDDWTITFAPTGDGRLEVTEAYCHEHRLDKAIDSLAERQREVGEQMYQNLKQAEQATS